MQEVITMSRGMQTQGKKTFNILPAIRKQIHTSQDGSKAVKKAIKEPEQEGPTHSLY